MADPRQSSPYASELFGVYKPLLGWRGSTAEARVARATMENVEREIARRAPAVAEEQRPLPERTPDRRPDFTEMVIREGRQFAVDVGREPTSAEWMATVQRAGASAPTRFFSEAAAPTAGIVSAPPAALTIAAGVVTADSSVRDIVTENLLAQIASGAPEVLNKLTWGLKPPDLRLLDPLADFDPAATRALLSPIGILNLYRQLFYDLDTFLGPPVGHVWVSPGATVEVYEVHSKRTVVEREDTMSVDVVTRSERETQIEDELSTSIKDEDERSLQMGASASLSGGIPGIVQGSASANMSLEQSHHQSREEAHRVKRTQTERLSNEIRQSFRTTLRTTVETQDTSSRRHVLQNNTDTLVNYELRRKMRQVGVAVQHVGTQLCWQVFLDDPRRALDPGAFIHVAKIDDRPAIVPPDTAPAAPTDIAKTFTVRFPFDPIDREARDDGEDEDYAVDPTQPSTGLDVNQGGYGRISFRKNFPVVVPADFWLTRAVITSVSSDGSSATPPHVVYDPAIPGDDGKSVWIQLSFVNFNDASAIVFTLDAVFEPLPVSVPAAATADLRASAVLAEQAATKAKREEAATAATLEAATLTALRERVKLERSVRARPAADLRDEERIVVYRMLLKKLHLPTLAADEHLTVELIRAVFEVDHLLYFVAQDWWRPHATRRSAGAPPYPITEESEPARMGSSLGWFLQVDGDARRNAFLNTPWVKAVLPIRPGMEAAAMRWLTSAGVEGCSGLDERYGGPEPELQGMTLHAALLRLAGQVTAEGPGFGPPTETVYERGFDSLEGGFRAVSDPFAVFDRWVEILPTDQVVAVPYTPPQV